MYIVIIQSANVFLIESCQDKFRKQRLLHVQYTLDNHNLKAILTITYHDNFL